MSHEPSGEAEARDLKACLEDPALTEGQRRRLAIFGGVEAAVSERVELLCEQTGVEVSDVAVLVVAPTAPEVFFGDGLEKGTHVVLGHRERVHAFLGAVLPVASDAEIDPYVDLLERAPDRCVRVLILDHESLTVMSYGTFVTLNVDPARVAIA